MSETPELEIKIAALRAEAEQCIALGDNPAAAYYADWLLFFMDARASAMEAWERSIQSFRFTAKP